MTDWKEDLSNKFNTIKKEEENVCIRIDSRINNRISNRGVSRGVYLSPNNKEIKKENNVTEKGGNRMITVEGALKDLEAIEKEANDTGAKAVVKALKVVVKFLSTMRSNQLLTEDDKKRISAEKAKKAAEKK